MRFWVILCLFVSSLQALSKASPSPLGVRTLEYEDTQRSRPVLIELWYPTSAKAPLDLTTHSVWVHPQEVRNSRPVPQLHPLIVMSHGHGGDRRYLSWLVEHFVRKGFLVASVEHYGNSSSTYDLLNTLRFWERARDISFAITHLLEEPFLKGSIDPHRIGFVGYSLGGMTGLSLGGAPAQNVKEIMLAQQKNFKEFDPEMVAGLDFMEASGDFSDSRIKAIALLSPATFVFPAPSLKQVKVPVALVASKGDEVLPFQEHAHRVMTHLVPAKLKLLKEKASHYVFMNRISPRGKEVLSREIQAESIESDRLSIHREVGPFLAEFFQEQLNK